MAKQIIRQPNGKYCLFSSVVDNITHFDLDEEKIVDVFVEEAEIRIKDEVKRVIRLLDKNVKPYFQATLSYNDMIETIEAIHGKDESEAVKFLIETQNL